MGGPPMRLARLVRVMLVDTLADFEGIAGEFRIQGALMRAEGARRSARPRDGRGDPAGSAIAGPGHASRVGVESGMRRPS